MINKDVKQKQSGHYPHHIPLHPFFYPDTLSLVVITLLGIPAAIPQLGVRSFNKAHF